MGNLLDKINGPNDIHRIRPQDYAKLAEETKEIRSRMSDMLDELSKGW